MNPFCGTTISAYIPDVLIERTEKLAELKQRVWRGRQTVLMGAEGSGKTTLLNSIATRSFRLEAARRGILISRPIEFTENIGKTEIYTKLFMAIMDAVPILEQTEQCSDGHLLKKNLNEIAGGSFSEYDKFVSAVHRLADLGYRIVFLIDNFEYFTSSPEITMEHHEVLRSLLQHSQYIVATGADLNQDSLPPHVSGSYLLMVFASGELLVPGWSEADCRRFLESMTEGCPIRFSDALIEKIHVVSGGIPFLVNAVANAAYNYIEENGTEEGLSFIRTVYGDAAVQNLMKRWSTMLTDRQLLALRAVADEENMTGTIPDELQAAAGCLVKRGLLCYYTETDKYGRVYEHRDRYTVNCALYNEYILKPGLLERAMEENPLRSSIRGEEPITAKELAEYYISEEEYNAMHPEVQIFIKEGIRVREELEDMTLTDYAIVGISFCKALEVHLYHTLIPIMKHVFGGNLLNYGGRTMRFCDIDHRLMALGNMSFALNTKNKTFGTRWYEDIIKAMHDNRIDAFDKTFWTEYLDDLKVCTDCRNMVPHKDVMPKERYHELLRTLFQGESGMMKRTSRLYQAAKSVGLADEDE